ncbi:MAG: hypothetical protein JEZ08_10595 [Clostridiales bacterium]|nr:hypothetical protein [Clostridiales bacterium]
MKNIIIDQKIFELYPETSIAIIKLSGFVNSHNLTETILRDAEKYVRSHYNKPILELPEIKDWRDTYKQLHIKKGTRVSSEALIKRVLKGGLLPSINPLVDIYNSISLKYVFPCGGEDLKMTQGDINLTFANGLEEFKMIGSSINEPPTAGEVVYKDELGCLCRCWNWREADRTKLTGQTTDAILVIESLNASRLNELNNAVSELKELCEIHLEATVSYEILNKKTQSWRLE